MSTVVGAGSSNQRRTTKMSGSNVAHVSSVDKGLKMKIKRTKVPNKVDSKHEVVKSDPLTKHAASPSGQPSAGVSMPEAASSSTTSFPSSPSTAAASSASGNQLSFMHSPSSLAPPTSSTPVGISSSLASSASVFVTSQLVTVTNPTVALLKAVSAGVIADAYSGSNMGGASKSPLKNAPAGAQPSDAKDGKSPKTKAAYSKKTKDGKGKSDVPVTTGHIPPASGLAVPLAEIRTNITVTNGSPAVNYNPSLYPAQAGVSSAVTSEPRPGDTVHMKRENTVHDPYEFNAKVEDKIELPPKKLKVEKVDCIETAISPQHHHHQHSPTIAMLQAPAPPPPHHHHQQQQQQQQPHKRSIGVDVCSVGVATEPESLGPCEPGTSVGLEGIVWKETDNGLLVVNVTWRGKTYVGTLMDATRYAWAPPRPNGCESPVSDFESRTPKGRGKRTCRSSVQSSERIQEGRRLRKGRRGTVNSSISNFTAPPSPAKSDISTGNLKRKTKPNDLDNDKPKRSRSCSRGVTGTESPTPDGYIVCPEPNCHKKYKHMNGLRYHRTHAHRKSSLTDDVKDEEEEEEEEEEKAEKKEKSSSCDRSGRTKAKEKQRIKEQQRSTDRDSKDSLDDDIPLKEIANKASSHVSDHKTDSSGAVKDRSEQQPSSNENEETSVAVPSTSASTRIEPQVVLTKTNIHLQTDSGSPVTASTACKKKDKDMVDDAPLVASSVPSKPSRSESPLSVVVNSSISNVDAAAAPTSRPPQVCSSNPPGSSSSGTKLVSQASGNFVTTQTTTINSTTAGQTVHTAPSPLQAVIPAADRQNSNKGPGFVKGLTAVRPIVPALSPQMANLGSSHSQTSSSSVQPHGFALKLIQPKPTIMGDYSLVNPSLNDLSKDKSRKPKKKKDTPSTVDPGSCSSKPLISNRESSSIHADTISQEDAYKCERTAVIKNSNPSKLHETPSPSNEVSKLPFQSLLNSPKLQSSVSSESPGSGRSHVAVPPSTLSVPCTTTDSKSVVDDDVHSPAYSDISDANDSNSPFQQDSPKKDTLKKDNQVSGPSHLAPDGSALSQHYGNMFFYGAPPNYLPHGINSQMSSPTLSDTLLKKDDIEVNRSSSTSDNSQDKKDGARCLQEAELQQKSVINYYAHLHGVSPAAIQLQFDLAGYNSPTVDSSYAMLEQQKRLLQLHEMAVKSENASGKRTPSVNRPIGPGYEPSGRLNVGVVGQMEQKRAVDDRDLAQKDKSSEVQHLQKESIDLKSQLGLHQEQQNYQLKKQQQQQQTDLLRAQMYQQQKQKMYESQRQEKLKGPPELTNAGPQHPGTIPRHPAEIKPQDLIPHDMIKKEPTSSKDISKMEAMDSKRLEIKEEEGSIQSRPSSSSHDSSLKPGSLNQSSSLNIPQSSLVPVQPSLSSPVAASLPVSLVTSVPGAAAAAVGFPYTPYYPHFRPVQLDPVYRALNPHIIGYAPAPPGYIHPTQLGYRMSVVDADRKSPDTVDPPRGDGAVTAAGYTPVHKIYELNEKNRASSETRSPASIKSGAGDNPPGPSTPGPPHEKGKDKPREYSSSPPTHRHVHTHHHTHVFPPLYTPDAYTMFGHPAAAAAAAATIQAVPHPFPPPSAAAPSAPKS